MVDGYAAARNIGDVVGGCWEHFGGQPDNLLSSGLSGIACGKHHRRGVSTNWLAGIRASAHMAVAAGGEDDIIVDQNRRGAPAAPYRPGLAARAQCSGTPAGASCRVRITLTGVMYADVILANTRPAHSLGSRNPVGGIDAQQSENFNRANEDL